MDAMERLLQDDLNRLLDRLAAATPPGAVGLAGMERPDLSARAGQLEADIARCREAMLLHYTRWGESLEELAGLWALAAVQHAGVPAGEVDEPAVDLRAA